MKLPFPISDFRFPISKKSERGIALVITLILLAVTLVMAVAFLALSRRDRNAVATTTDTATARLAADSALAAAQAQIVANVFATTNTAAYDFKLLVSTNYINDYGYVIGSQNPTNVNYDYRSDNNALNANDLVQNIANLWFLPRVPVFVNTNNGNPLDFRYYLDLNRNTKFEDSGDNVPNVELNASGNPFTNGVGTQVGDPQWIGVLERPDQPHGPNNKFVARYAFLAQPIGNSLDLNFIHNNARRVNAAADRGDFRNPGVGSWELNLAAFLADLNTNKWFASGVVSYYDYQPLYSGGPIAQYAAFDDALSLLNYRYGGGYGNLATAGFLFGNNTFPYDNIDGYSDGLLQISTPNIDESVLPRDNDTLPWSGADNPNRFFSVTADLFDASKVTSAFATRLQSLGSSNATYDRYTFYRMLDQLGTDSSADAGKMNLNYRNVTNGMVVAGLETNMYPWTALDFFTNAANRLLQHYTTRWATNRAADPFNADTNYVATFNVTAPFDISSIPVWVSNKFVYTPAVNRLLQLAANLYDASTNTYFPSVFRPTFKVLTQNGYDNVYISGFQEIGSHFLTPNSPPLDEPLKLGEIVPLPGGPRLLVQNAVNWNAANANIYGVPWIIGAKKGFPNFNQFVNRSTVQLTRKLQVSRTKTTVGALDPSNVVTTN